MNVKIKPTALKRIAEFLRETGGDMKATLTFSRTASALVLAVARRLRSRGVIAPAAVVAHYDSATTFRVFDSLDDAFDAFKEYRAENAPAVLLTINSITIERGAGND